MNESTQVRLVKWPFVVGDVLLVGVAVLLLVRVPHPWTLGTTIACAATVALGAWLAVLPFLLEYRAATRQAEAEKLTAALAQIRKLELVATRVDAATAQWQNAHEAAERTAQMAGEIVKRMSGELAGFTEFLQKMNEGERNALRLEVEKLRRAEGEWLQVVVHMLDHLFALHQAALRSGQANVIEQTGRCQDACRDIARRLGVIPFAPAVGDPFDPQRHLLPDGEFVATEGAKIAETIAPGYTFQGRLIRSALVQVCARPGSSVQPAAVAPNELRNSHEQLAPVAPTGAAQTSLFGPEAGSLRP